MRPLLGQPTPKPEERGAALLLSFLVLMVIIAIVYQLNRVTGTDQQIADKNLQLAQIDSSIRSAILEVLEQLREDGELRLGSDEGGAAPEGVPDIGGDAEGSAAESNPDAVDSQMDEWAQVAATAMGDVQLRVFVEDEDRKYNILNMLNEDEELAQLAFDRVARILDYCRENTEDDISSSDAEEMARAMRRHMAERDGSVLPRPRELLSDNEERDDVVVPLSMREFLAIEPFEAHHFRDYFDTDEVRVHAITQYLTLYTSPSTGGGGGQAAVTAPGGHNVNLNTAPLAVLMGLFDSRDINGRFWDDVIEYRNDEEEAPPDVEEGEEILDEFGEPIIQKQFFDSLEELNEISDWEVLEAEVKGVAESLLRVDSDVFSITITGRVETANEINRRVDFRSRREQELYERSGLHLVRTVRSVYWRQINGDEVQMIPLIPWEVLDYAPLPVQDYGDDD
ncbi:MAG: hypothetical protein O2816_02225 [Planctomycetota bacterium]|nr:hypothetical protein [Planctomycetota bacterium]